MARLRLRLDKYFEGDTGNTRVVARVRPLGGKPGAAPQGKPQNAAAAKKAG